MIKRHQCNPKDSTIRKGDLSFIASDSRRSHDEQQSLPYKKAISKPPHPHRKRSTVDRKVKGLVLVLGGVLFFSVLSVCFFGTRYVLLASPLEAGGMVHGDLFHLPKNGKSNIHNQSTTFLSDSQRSNYFQKPRIVGYSYDTPVNSTSFLGIEPLDRWFRSVTISPVTRPALQTKDQVERQKHLENSQDYAEGEPDSWDDMGPDCVAQYGWQDGWIPTCNHLMEVDATNFQLLSPFHRYNSTNNTSLASGLLHSYISYLAHGYWRDVWKIENVGVRGHVEEEAVILKTMRYNHTFDGRNYDRHRRDSMTMERLTFSNYTTNIYAACGNSGLFEYADGGSLNSAISANNEFIMDNKTQDLAWTTQEKLIIGYQAASGLADVHNFAKEGVPAIAHTDVTAHQFVYIENTGTFKLNDFNEARFLGKHNGTQDLCPYYVGENFESIQQSTSKNSYNSGIFRSPEEYKHEGQSEKVDVYSLGNVLYQVLTGDYPFEDIGDVKIIQAKVKAGERPKIPDAVHNSTDPTDQVFLEAMKRCWIQDPKQRASSREIQMLLALELERLGIQPSL